MTREVKFKAIVIIIIAVLCAIYVYVNFIYKISVDENYESFFKQMISMENYNLIKDGKYEKLADNLKLYCNERGLDVIMSNREIRYNYNFIEKHNIKSYKDLIIELIDESSDDNINFREYKISYTYIDNKKKENKMTDYYQLNIKDGKIDFMKIDSKRSTVGSN